MLSRESIVGMHISPASWGLPPRPAESDGPHWFLSVSPQELERRCRACTCEWLMKQFDEQAGAFYGYYDPRTSFASEPQTANLIAPWQLLAAFDRYQDELFLEMAARCIDWLDDYMVDLHPMSLVLGGVQDNLKSNQLWTKYTADYVFSNLGVYRRTANEEYLARGLQSGKFLLQAQRHNFAPLYDRWQERWTERGWQSFGRVAGAMLALANETHDRSWLDWAVEWARHGSALQADDGCMHLINGQYYSSDIAADEIRALASLGAVVDDVRLTAAATRFADWHIRNQRPDGSWWLAIDRGGVPVSGYVGPGDVSNIAIALILMHWLTDDIRYLASAVRALEYSVGCQAVPGEEHPYSEDELTQWGFWSWDPPYDYTMSPDQATHHVRAFWFLLDYSHSLPEDVLVQLSEALADRAQAG